MHKSGINQKNVALLFTEFLIEILLSLKYIDIEQHQCIRVRETAEAR